MIHIALDTATDRCTVAATDGTVVAHRVLDGSRRHAGAILGLLDEALAELGKTPREITHVLTGDGPGSFTGLRVAASVAKALVWRHSVEWRTAPSLLIRAAAHVPAGGGAVLALSDALRGQLYAGCWQFRADGSVAAVNGPPRAMFPVDLAAFGAVQVVTGTVPAALAPAVSNVTNSSVIGGEAALPDARVLLSLGVVSGATMLITDPAAWEPEYGRRKHRRSGKRPMGNDFRIRPASSADVERLAAMERIAFSDPWTVEQLSNALSWLGAVGLIAEDASGEIAGYVIGRVIVDEGEILTIATDPERRRTGIGRRLLGDAMTTMSQRGAHSAWLEVRRSNAAALAMYSSAGFVAAGVRRGYYRQPPEDALILRRELAPSA